MSSLTTFSVSQIQQLPTIWRRQIFDVKKPSGPANSTNRVGGRVGAVPTSRVIGRSGMAIGAALGEGSLIVGWPDRVRKRSHATRSGRLLQSRILPKPVRLGPKSPN